MAYYFENDVLYTLWFGLLFSLTAHFVVHIGQSIYIKKYIPSLITSIICLPIYENKYNVKDWTFDVYVTVFDKTNYKSNEKDNTEKESYNQIVEKYKKLLGVSEVNWS